MKFKLIYLMALLLLITACSQLSPSPPTPTPTFTPVPTPTRTAEDILAEGWAAYEDGEYETAEATANLLIERDETLPGPWELRGFVYFKMNEFDKALADLIQAMDLGSKNEDVYGRIILLQLSTIYFSWNPENVNKSIEGIRAALLELRKINPENEIVQQLYGFIFREADFGKDYTGINPKAVEYLERGDDMVGTGESNWKDVLDEFTKAIEEDENFAVAYERAGAIYYALGEYETALEYFNQAVEINPQLVEPRRFLGETYANLNLPLSARNAYVDALLLYPEYEYVIDNMKILNAFIENWEWDYFSPFGFRFYYPNDLEISILDEPYGNPTTEQGAVKLSNDEYLIVVLWQDLGGGEPLPLEGAVELAQSPIENDSAMNFEGDPIEFKYGEVPIIIQLYTYTPPSKEFTSSGAFVIPLCQTKFFSMQFEYPRVPLDEVVPNISLHLDLFSCGEE